MQVETLSPLLDKVCATTFLSLPEACCFGSVSLRRLPVSPLGISGVAPLNLCLLSWQTAALDRSLKFRLNHEVI